MGAQQYIYNLCFIVREAYGFSDPYFEAEWLLIVTWDKVKAFGSGTSSPVSISLSVTTTLL